MSLAIPEDKVHALLPGALAAPVGGASRGPLQGLTFMAKDLFAVKGAKRANGNGDLYARAAPETENAAAVQALLDAGASLTGIAICDEFFYSLLGTNAHFGDPINPKAPGRVTGGSSCGAAAATAAGLCDFALGSDTGGSIRVPAAFCGLYGLRPTFARIGLEGATPMAPSFDTAGFLAADPALMPTIGAALLDDRKVEGEIGRMVLAEDLFASAAPELAHQVNGFLMGCAPELPPPERVALAGDKLEAWRDAFRTLQGREVQETLLPLIAEYDLRLGPGIAERFAMAAAITAEQAAAAQELREEASRLLLALAQPGTIIALPTAPTLPPRAGIPDGPENAAFRADTLKFTCPAGLAGLPQISIPAGTVEGCPVGVSFIGWHGGDEALLELAATLAT